MIKNFILILIIIILNFLLGCKTFSLKEKDVTKLDFSLVDFFQKSTSSVIPNNNYFLKVIAYTKDGKIIKTPNHNDLIINSENSTFKIINHNFFNIELYAIDDSFYLVENKNYSVSVKIKENQFSEQKLNFPINWNSFNKLNFTGMEGSSGSNGQDGRNGSNGSSSFLDGGDGSDGHDGGRGWNGKNVKIAVSYYDIKGMNVSGIDDSKMIIIYELTTKKVFLTKLQTITIDASGGKGGKGGNGGNSGKGGVYTDYKDSFDKKTKTSDTKRGKNGNPGKGGNGGPGGNGGSIEVLYINDSINEYIVPISLGGKGGDGGDGGDRSSFLKDHNEVFKGNDGIVNKTKLTTDEIKEIFKGIDNKYFDLNRIIEN